MSKQETNFSSFQSINDERKTKLLEPALQSWRAPLVANCPTTGNSQLEEAGHTVRNVFESSTSSGGSRATQRSVTKHH